MDRRTFLERSLLGLAALASTRSLSGCGSDATAGTPARRVAIVGGGLAGLTCAYRLKQAGVQAHVYEASKRLGGRTYTARGMFPDGQVAELGGEFIDTGHLTMHALAEELGIALDDRPAELGEGVSADVWWVEGRAVPEATLVDQFKQVAERMANLVAAAEEDDATFEALDQTSMAAWLDENLSGQPELKSVLENAYRGEYGRELDEQSVLNLLYLIGSDDPDPFRIFGVSDERYHAHAGSETFAEKLAESLDEEQLLLEHKLVKAAAREQGGYLLTFETAAGERAEVAADYVVFALPFTALRNVDLRALGLSDEKRAIIEELNYGTNAKVMGAFETRVWLHDHGASGSVTSDEPFQQCWDTSIGQDGESGLLTNFLGGEQGVRSGESSPEEWYTEVTLAGVEQVFPGAQAAYVAGSAVRMHWPSHPFTLGSYACYAPGQWAFYGLEGLPEQDGTLQFCGEHTSLEFQGYMEGAAETGSLVAAALLEKLGVSPSDRHEAWLTVQRGVPQPAFGERVSPRDFLRRARKAHAARLALAQGSLLRRAG